MTYSQIAQTPDAAPTPFSRGNGTVPLPSTTGAGQVVGAQASFTGTYGGGSYSFRATIQSQTSDFIDPGKQYRLTIEEVQP